MSKMGDFVMWVEDVILSTGYDPDDPYVQGVVNANQGELMSAYMGNDRMGAVSKLGSRLYWVKANARAQQVIDAERKETV